jgi:hypothetical protein
MLKRQIRTFSHTLLLPALLWSAVAGAEEPDGAPTLQKSAAVADIDNSTRIDANNIDMFVTNHGSFAYDIPSSDAGLFFPKGTNRQAVFASGIWIGGQLDGDIRVTVGEFSQEFAPGPMVNGEASVDGPQNRTFKISRKEGPGTTDWNEWPAHLGAPMDELGNPRLLGDMTLWSVYNDADHNFHSNRAGNSDPLGIEVQQTTFAFNRQGPLGNIVFLKFLLINKGSNQIDDTFVSVWCDPDLGGASDDLVGCDTDLSLGFCYNATNNDEQYGLEPPAVGYDFFLGPRGDTGAILPMTSFNKYINGTDPQTPIESYNYMRGLESDGDPLINPVTSRVTTFFHPGDPVMGTGWNDSNPADRRFMLSSGPFTFAPGDTQEVVAAVIVAQGSDRLSSITLLKFYDSFAQDAFDKDFDLPSPPLSPQVSASQQDRKVILTWPNTEADYQEPGYIFEGYNIYQGESVAGPWKRIATYDIADNVTVIFDETFDPSTGLTYTQPVQFGSDKGLAHYIELENDELQGGKLVNAKSYYYAVTAYGYGPEQRPIALESAIEPIRVVPQTPLPGTDLSTAAADFIPTYSRVSTAMAATTDSVRVTVVDPTQVTGHRYQVTFTDLPEPQLLNGEMVESLWNLWDLDANRMVLENQSNRLGDDNYDVVDGLQVKVIGSNESGLINTEYIEGASAIAQGLQSFDWGGQYYEGALDYGRMFFGSSLDPAADLERFSSVEIRFSNLPNQQQKAYRYLRGGTPDYAYQDFVSVPFTVWDPVLDRQLNCAFVENNEAPSQNGRWAPDTSPEGGYEYLVIFSSTYSETPDPLYVSNNLLFDAPRLDVQYVVWLTRKVSGTVVDEGDKLRIDFAHPSDSNDRFVFTTTAAVTDSIPLAQQQLDDIRVVPNPYYGRSSYELDQFNRVVKFTNLPAACTVRIFSLSGVKIRTLEKNDPNSSILEWDLLTDNRLPPASGVYIYHVEADGIGTHIGKLAIFVEQERLQTF